MSNVNPSEQLDNGAVPVDDSATLIFDSNGRRRSVVVRNLAGSDTVFLGKPDVEDTDGFPLAAGEALRFDDLRGQLHAICASAESADVRFLEVG